ncbi:zinc finger domain protein [Apiospora arundinis]|uniref:Zinc finger domain protein n=1 Tax=Apiospora arundinis TaxID=335852 RepID=A0ABR2I1C9_9PEZI
MYETPILRPSPVEGLSVELVRLVLSALPNVASLQATVLSCPLFYKMDPSILHDAIAAYESSRLRLNGIYNEESSSNDKDGLRSFIDQDIRLRPDMPTFWSLQQVLRVTRLHGLVCEIATKFVNDAAAGSPLKQTGFISVTHQERCRIERALYRFEIYCNLFRTLLSMPGLGRANDRTNIIVLKWLTPEDGNLLRIKEPHRPDSDSDSDTGPADSWRWAHREDCWAHQAKRRDLRLWGYAMWNRSRLDAINLFREPWRGSIRCERDDPARATRRRATADWFADIVGAEGANLE